MTRLKILLAASACHPIYGSEPAVGWRAAVHLAENHDVWVITHANGEQDILEAQRKGIGANIHFVFIGKKHTFRSNLLIVRLQTWLWFLEYQRAILPIAQALHAKIHFDIAQHVTISTWRVGSPLWQLNIPFIWGPIGGCGRLPFRLYNTLSLSGVFFELAREFSTFLAKISRSVRDCAKHSPIVVASNQEARIFLRKIRKKDEGLLSLVPIYFSEDTLSRFAPTNRQENLHEPLKFFSGGFIISTKGLSLALKALALAKASGVRFTYQLAGRGPEIPSLTRLVQHLKLQNEVTICDLLDGDDYIQALNHSDIVILPSFRENIGITMMEAMLCGNVPIVVNASGQAEIVTDACGFRIPVTSYQSIIQGLCDAICFLNKHRSKLATMGIEARHRVKKLSRSNYDMQIQSIYEQALITNHKTNR